MKQYDLVLGKSHEQNHLSQLAPCSSLSRVLNGQRNISKKRDLKPASAGSFWPVLNLLFKVKKEAMMLQNQGMPLNLTPGCPRHPQGECLPTPVPKSLPWNQREEPTVAEVPRVWPGTWSR